MPDPQIEPQPSPSIAAQVFSGDILKKSLIVALFVGTILNAINQGDAILAGGSITAWKILLTYAVPFFVASYGAYNAMKQRQ